VSSPATLEDPVDDRVSKAAVVEHMVPARERFVGREDHGAPLPLLIIDDVEACSPRRSRP
jgi:hypothetical protein